jgi:hypothetical protein
MKENIPSFVTDEKLVTFEASLERARALCAKHKDEITYGHQHPYDDGVSRFRPEQAILHFLQQFPVEVLEDFYGHGIVRNDEEFQVAALLNMIENKTMRGDQGRLVQGPSTFIPAYTSAPFLVLSHYKKSLEKMDEHGKTQRNSVGLVIDPGAFVLNNAYYCLSDDLRAMFPSEKIIKANELPTYIQSEISE